MQTAKLTISGKEYELPVVVGSENEVGIDISTLRDKSGAITLDSGYGNTGSCQSSVTFIDGDLGILRYRGYPIEELAAKSNFEETAYLLFYGQLPTATQLEAFKNKVKSHSVPVEEIKKLIDHFPKSAHPMSVLMSVTASLASYYDDNGKNSEIEENMIRLFAMMKSIVAWIYSCQHELPYNSPDSSLSYSADFLQMTFSQPGNSYELSPAVVDALDKILILHADHEQNCSTSTIRMAGSSKANIYASAAAAIAALWGPLHGGANQEVIQMLEKIKQDGSDYKKYVAMAKDKNSGFRLMGFGHRVYKNFDPRAKIIKSACDKVLHELNIDDPLLDIARNLEQIALEDEYFVSRKLYPNVDFYSGIIYKAIGIPVNMFTVMFALGRMPGWLSHFKEMREDPTFRINRPRQIYTGSVQRPYPELSNR